MPSVTGRGAVEPCSVAPTAGTIPRIREAEQCLKGNWTERSVRVEPYGLALDRRTAGIGALPSLPAVPAKVPSRSDLPTFRHRLFSFDPGPPTAIL